MNVWLRRLLILLFVLFWLVLILTPSLGFILARNGLIQIGPSEGRHWRLFVIQELDAEGVGLERSRPVSLPFDAPESAMCLKTTISYWMWSGEGQGTSYCQCVDSAAGNLLDITPPACLIP